MAHLTYSIDENNPVLNADELVRAWGSSPTRLKYLLNRYRRAGFTDGQIVAAMAQSAVIADAIGRRR